MKRRIFTAGLAGLALAGRGAFAAPPPADTRAVLNVFRPATDADIQLMNHAIARFKPRYPSVEIKVQYVSVNPWGEYINQFMNAMGSGENVDIVSMPTEGASTLGSRKLLIDLSEYLAADPAGKEVLADVEPNLLTALRYNGVQGLFPTEWNTVTVFYNTDMFQEAGLPPPAPEWTWDDLLATAQKLTKRDAAGRVTQYGYVIPGGQFALSTWMLTNATDRLSADGKQSNVRDPKFRETLEFLHDLIHKHKVSPAFARNDYGYGPFVAKQAAMLSSTHPVVRILREAKFTSIDVVNPPRRRTDTMICGALGIGMTQATKNPALAWEFMKVLFDKEAQEELAANVRSIPSRRSAASLPVWLATPKHAEIFYGAAAKAKPLFAPPNFAQVEEIMMRHIEAYLTANQDIGRTIDGMDEEISRAMARVKW